MAKFVHVSRTVSKHTANCFNVDRWINTNQIGTIEHDEITGEVVAVTNEGTAYVVDIYEASGIDEVLQLEKPKTKKPDNYGTTGYTDF